MWLWTSQEVWFRSFVSAGEPRKGIARLWLAKLTLADAPEVHTGCVQTFVFWMFTDLDITEQAPLVLVTAGGDTGCAPGHAREGDGARMEQVPTSCLNL